MTTDETTRPDAGLEIPSARVVITGAGSGIGAAVATALAALGARVLVNDLDPAAAKAVADRIGADHFACDVGDPASVQHLVDTAVSSMGGIDLFCANAGIALTGSLDPAAWELPWRVNVMAHVHAARSLLPGWLAAGRGRLVTTVSAAGLLTMLGNAPYSVTKHAALAFSEWLRMTYAHRGITVQALCPLGVTTPMFADADPRSVAVLAPGAISPEAVAVEVVRALAGDRFLILPQPEVTGYVRNRSGDVDRWLATMNRTQQRLEVAHPMDAEL